MNTPALTPKMETRPIPTSTRPLNGAGRRLVLAMLARLQHGRLTLVDGPNRASFGQLQDDDVVTATIRVHQPDVYRFCAFGGSVGAAEAFMLGYWSADDLTAVMRIFARNQHVFQAMDQGWSVLSRPVNHFFHLTRKNTPTGSRENIMAHYDLGNDFYRLFLDETMTYSCGIFETPEGSLKAASLAKYDRLCRKLELKADDHVLEIGTGWGGFALHAARHYGCRVTTTTISQQQYDYAKQRFAEAGLSRRIRLLNTDYRELNGQFDKLVSIEMIEAVGHHYFDTFFRQCSRYLKATGLMALQAITIADQAYERAKRDVDFIKRYIFPGSCLPSLTALMTAMAVASDMRLVHLEDITPHYAITLRRWRERFFANIERVRELGFEEPFIRMWHYYLSYCEGGFLERYIGDLQMIFAKPENRREPILAGV